MKALEALIARARLILLTEELRHREPPSQR
jgi:hypothetical protein